MKPKRYGLRRIWMDDCFGGRRSVPWSYWVAQLFLRLARWLSKRRGCEHFVCCYNPDEHRFTRPVSFQRAQELNAKFGGEIRYDPDQDLQT
jgi:hypothetical protein